MSTDDFQSIVDREAIRDAILRYARAVDRNDWTAVRDAYHGDAYDDHGAYKGGVDGLIVHLKRTFPVTMNGMHFIGNCLIELAGPKLALAETYFISERIYAPELRYDDERSDPTVRTGWGRYVDRFEKRGGAWRIAHRTVVMDAIYTAPAVGATRRGSAVWGSRSPDDPVFMVRAEIFAQ